MIVDFKEIESSGGYDFERFIEDLLESLGWTIHLKAGQGPDGGRDIVASIKETLATGKVVERKYLIQCKHFAHSNATVRPKDIIHFDLMPAKHSTNGWLLVTSTKVSQDVINTIVAAENTHKGIVFDSWDARTLEKLVLSERSRTVFKRYFPRSYAQNTNILIPTLHELHELLCEWKSVYENYASKFFVNQEMEQYIYSAATAQNLTLDEVRQLFFSDVLLEHFNQIWEANLQRGDNRCGIALLFNGLQRLFQLQEKGLSQGSIEIVLCGELSLSTFHRDMKRRCWKDFLIHRGKNYNWTSFHIDHDNAKLPQQALCGLSLIVYCEERKEAATGEIRVPGKVEPTKFAASMQLESSLHITKFPLDIPLVIEYKLDTGSDMVSILCVGYAWEVSNRNGLRNVQWYHYV